MKKFGGREESIEMDHIAAKLYNEGEGWIGYTIDDSGKYYFNDVPEPTFYEAFIQLNNMVPN